jgi:hypothetical protein
MIVNNILRLGPLHIAAESRSHAGGLICGSGFDSAELVEGQPRTKMESDTHIYPLTANAATNRR